MNILLVEDNRSDAMLLKEFFSEKENTPEIHWVTDGHDALDYLYGQNQYAGAERPDVILLDLGLPRISGYDVLREVKKKPPYADIPVIILTTSCSPLDKNQCMALGADRVMSKPQNLKEYESLVDKLMLEELPRLVNHNGNAHLKNSA